MSDVVLAVAKMDGKGSAHLTKEDTVLVISIPVGDVLDLLVSTDIERELTNVIGSNRGCDNVTGDAEGVTQISLLDRRDALRQVGQRHELSTSLVSRLNEAREHRQGV